MLSPWILQFCTQISFVSNLGKEVLSQCVFCEKPAFSVVLFLPLKWLEMADMVVWFGFFFNSWLFIIPSCSIFLGLFIFAFCLKEREGYKQGGSGLASLQEQMESAAKNSKCSSRLEVSHGPKNGDASQLNLLRDLLFGYFYSKLSCLMREVK